jgi:hypothetical protein
MGIFDRFKKEKEPEYDVTNLSVHDFKKGFVFEYNLKSWIVKEEYQYDWGDNFFTYEFKIDSGDELLYLHFEDDDELEISISSKIKIRAIDEDLPEHIIKFQEAPKKINYQGETYLLDGESPGFFHNNDHGEDAWDELISWNYFNEAEDKVITIEQWGDKEFEASCGLVVKEYEISNILPHS